MTMTKTRRKQKQEMMNRALRLAEERKIEERRAQAFTSIPLPMQAAFEPALFQPVDSQLAGADHDGIYFEFFRFGSSDSNSVASVIAHRLSKF